MAQDLILVQIFYLLIEAMEIMLLELIQGHTCILIIKEKNILIPGKEPTQGLDGTTFAAKALYPINFIQTGKRFVLSLYYNENNSFLFFNATKVYRFKAKNSEIKDYALRLGNVSKDTIHNMKKKHD